MSDTTTEIPGYDRLAGVLEDLGVMDSAAEAHGLTCALACTTPEGAERVKLTEVIEPFGLEEDEAAELLAILVNLARHCRTALLESDFDFALFLPGDDAPLDERIGAIAGWCRGFLYGLMEGGVTDLDKLPGDAAEITRDLVAIADVEPSEDEAPAEQERALTEVEEYVRVGVQLVFEELHARSAGGSDTRH